MIFDANDFDPILIRFEHVGYMICGLLRGSNVTSLVNEVSGKLDQTM